MQFADLSLNLLDMGNHAVLAGSDLLFDKGLAVVDRSIIFECFDVAECSDGRGVTPKINDLGLSSAFHIQKYPALLLGLFRKCCTDRGDKFALLRLIGKRRFRGADEPCDHLLQSFQTLVDILP